MQITLKKITGPNKYLAVVNGRNIKFGASGYSDYTIHKDPERKRRYLSRHMARENWGVSGIETRGFWSRWILWNKKTIEESIKDVERRFNVRIN